MISYFLKKECIILLKKIFSLFLSLLLLSSCLGSAVAAAQQVHYEGAYDTVQHGSSYVKYSKIAKQAMDASGNPIENQFDITLKIVTMENLQERIVEMDAITSLVLDVSGSMLWNIDGGGWCRNCQAWKHDHAGCSWSDRMGWPVMAADGTFLDDVNGDGVVDEKDQDLNGDGIINEMDKSRFYLMAEALHDFFDEYSGNGTAERWISLSEFGQHARDAQVLADLGIDWIDLNASYMVDGQSKSGLEIAKEAVSYPAYYRTALSQTAQGTGLEHALALMEPSATPDNNRIPNRFLILLTDGRPEGNYESFVDDEGNVLNNTDGTHGSYMADKVKQKGLGLFSIGFGTSSISMLDTSKYANVDAWLKSLASDEDHFMSVTAENKLADIMKKITSEISQSAYTKAWTLVDPMGPNHTFLSFESSSIHAVEKDGTITWNLRDEPLPEKNAQNEFEYSLTYRVQLNNTADGYQHNQPQLTNGTTTLTYFFKDEITSDGQVTIHELDFDIPQVKSYTGSLPVVKVDSRTGQPFGGAAFELTHDADCPCNDQTVFSPSAADQNGEFLFTDLPSGHTYTLKETKAPAGYTASDEIFTVRVEWGETTVYNAAGDLLYDSTQPGAKLTIENEPDTIVISGRKSWDDANNQDGIRPETVTIHLLDNGKSIASVTTSSDKQWAYSFGELPEYRNGQLIRYEVAEETVNGYQPIAYGYNLTNVHTPAVRSIPVTKIWWDNGDYEGIRPETVDILLYADGVFTQRLTLSEANNWRGVFTDLPRYHQGHEIVYTVQETPAEGYYVLIDGSMTDGFTVTNVCPRTPQTGDDTQLMLLTGAMLLSGTGILLAIRRRRHAR